MIKKLVGKKFKRSYYEKKCDRKMQEIGHKVWEKCEVCGMPQQVMHHFFTKKAHPGLRYYWKNLIPLCNGCHFQHHKVSNAKIHATIILNRGEDWYHELEVEDRKYAKKDLQYYTKVLNDLEIL